MDISSLGNWGLLKILLNLEAFNFLLLTVSLPSRSFPYLCGTLYQLLILNPESFVFCSKKVFPLPMCSTLFSIFSYMYCILIYFEILAPCLLDFCAGWQIWIYLHSSTCKHPVRQAPFVEDTFFSQLYCFESIVKQQMSIVYIHFLVFNLIPLSNLPISMLVVLNFHHFCSVELLDIRNRDSSRSILTV